MATEQRSGRTRWASLGWYALLILLALLVLFPVWMTVVRAMANPSKALLQTKPKLYPVDIQWNAFTQAFTSGNLGRPIIYSLVTTVLIVIGQTITSVLAAYGFAFLQFPFKRLLFAITVATLLLPIEVTVITNVKTFQALGWVNIDQSPAQAIGAMVLPFLATGLGVFLVRQGFRGIPRDLRDAATLDGYGHFRFLWKVAVPVTRPVIGSFVLISFLQAYNQYVWPRQVVTQTRNQTAQLALRSVAGQDIGQFNLPFAAALIVAVPVLILLIAFQRQIVRGLTAGAVKG